MQPLLLKLVVLTEAAALAVPPGACCCGIDAAPRPAKRAASCCRPARDESPRSRVPASPRAHECCCGHEAVPSGKPIALDHGWSLPSAVAVFDARPQLAGSLGALPAPEEFAPSPPLHLLHCVWLC
jgi:hypothetical protein